jgi:hypothetical protein
MCRRYAARRDIRPGERESAAMNAIDMGVVLILVFVVCGFYRVEKKLEKIEKRVADLAEKT